MVTAPTTHRAGATVGELRAFFADDHVHVALLVDNSVLLGAVERSDLDHELGERIPALPLARLDGRTVSPHETAEAARRDMRRAGRRRLAVTTREGELLGLLCLKKTGDRFCSDRDVASRRAESSPPARCPRQEVRTPSSFSD
jgi:CBS domain-containing protein